MHLVLEGLEQVFDLIVADARAEEVNAAIGVAAAPPLVTLAAVVPMSIPLAESPKEVKGGQTRGHF